MSERHRPLPSWMAKKGDEVKEKEPLKTRRKRKTARAAFYCMNEKQLVDVAVSYLINDAREDVALRTAQKVEVKAVDTAVKMKEDSATSKTMVRPLTEALEESSECSDAQETTYVSETDLDITELETVQYTKSPVGQRSGPAQDHGGLTNAGLEAEKKQKHSQMPADSVEEEDALHLVREIFFT